MAPANQQNQPRKPENAMANYKVVVHKDKFGTVPVQVLRQVDSRLLSEKIYGLTTEYPNCSISLYPERTCIIIKNASIKKQLEKFINQ